MASFEIDRQTIKDLGIFNDDGVSAYSIFNNVRTINGRTKLKEMMETPSFDIVTLSSRRDSIRFFYGKELPLDVKKNEVDLIEHYLSFNCNVLKANAVDAVLKGMMYQLGPNRDYDTIRQGIADICRLLTGLNAFYHDLLKQANIPPYIDGIIKIFGDFLNKKAIHKILSANSPTGYLEISCYDNLFRKAELVNLKNVLKSVYEIDVFISVAKAARDNGFCFPEYEVNDKPNISITALYHPYIKNAITNDVSIGDGKNICFLTGANMAGKSTYLKSLSLAVYLAHLGFPVPATAMKTTVFKGIITTINLSDNINNGYSHYFSEVKRLKKVAEKIAGQDNLFVVFDELFRGTNVKDAYDASLATINALSKIRSSVFLISTHIVEIATEIRVHENIVFKFFDSQIKDDEPVFDFKLKDGVSSETLGYFIFKNEGILQILARAVDGK